MPGCRNVCRADCHGHVVELDERAAALHPTEPGETRHNTHTHTLGCALGREHVVALDERAAALHKVIDDDDVAAARVALLDAHVARVAVAYLAGGGGYGVWIAVVQSRRAGRGVHRAGTAACEACAGACTRQCGV
eukprot:329963-Chlamydomonas_euryale.AAC.1